MVAPKPNQVMADLLSSGTKPRNSEKNRENPLSLRIQRFLANKEKRGGFGGGGGF